MPFNFLEKEANNRLIASIIGSVDNNINMKEIARIYGDSVSFNTIEWYLRKIRHQAAALKAEANGKPVPASTTVKKKAKKTSTASPAKCGVKPGSVTKKRAATSKVKSVVLEKDNMTFGKGGITGSSATFASGINGEDDGTGDEM